MENLNNESTINEQEYDQFETEEFTLASSGKRFANYIIDYIAFILFMVVLGSIWGMFNQSSRLLDDDPASNLLLRLIAIVLYMFFMTSLEFLLRGKTIGKMITGTRAIQNDGEFLSFKSAFVRSISRIVPFEAFSAFGNPPNPWHDRWSDTIVVLDK